MGHEKVADHSALPGHGVEAASYDPYAQVPLPAGDPLAIRLLEVLPDPSDGGTRNFCLPRARYRGRGLRED